MWNWTFSLAAAIGLLGLALAVPVTASPLRLDYEITPLTGGLYQYDFSLVVDNHDGSFIPGQGWVVIVFGDLPYGAALPVDPSDAYGTLADWKFTHVESPFMVGGTFIGGHNGPYIATNPNVFQVVDVWRPNLNDTITWTGTSSKFVGQGNLLFSTTLVSFSWPNPGSVDNFTPANYVTSIPEPESFAMMLAGLGLVGAAVRRRRG